ESLVEQYPHRPGYREQLAAALLRRGEALGQAQHAEAELNRSLAQTRLLIDRHGPQSSFLGVRGRTFLALGRLRAAQGKGEEAAARLGNAEKVFAVAVKGDPDNASHRAAVEDCRRERKGPR